MNKIFAGIVFLIFFSGCQRNNQPDNNFDPSGTDTSKVPVPELVFNTGFEPGTSMVYTNPQYSEIRGIDNSVSEPNDWVNDFVSHSNIGLFRIYYEQGDSSQRLAEIVTDPVYLNNKVLQFSIYQPHIVVPASSVYTVNGVVFDKKGRIQADMYGNNGLKEIFQSVRLFLPTDFNNFVNSVYPGTGDWITLFEFWNNAGWASKATYPFRFGVNIIKGSSTAGSPLYFKTEGQKTVDSKYVQVWYKVNTSFPVPVGKWFTIEYYIKEGNKGAGRFYFAVTPDGEAKTVIFDLKGDTCHPDDREPDGLTDLNPLKLYCSNNIINRMNMAGGIMRVYWDDFKFWINKRP